ncbi:hypothetical protein CJF42_25685 [Pseudoalteromonas sp. NBT06-2]|uniref:hypothetical protein n=1 Tax=Pseudoalteromonas sp. NBT06-2 TaxID=2025950 RepID=UPI000BA6E155|nr:hypothetical protein [Pseudoalteromonas sp. NBT06-2]PAJ71631.1 hypothetical protein CJF42_25685 [Pseudoalteromonas sp. NBT06-2]
MDTSNEKMKWILFWVFISLFILAVLGTLSVVFFGTGSPTETEREWLVKGLILEVAACVIALFYSIFGIKKSNESNSDKVLSDIEIRVKELEEKLLLSTKEIDHSTPTFIDSEALDARADFMDRMHPFLTKITGLTTPPAFDEEIYNINPSYPKIVTDIKNVKPFDKKHRTESYIGLKVQWKCAFSEFDEKEDCYRVRAYTEEPLHAAYLNIDKSKNVSKLKVLDENHPFWVCGEISEITGTNIELVNADILV